MQYDAAACPHTVKGRLPSNFRNSTKLACLNNAQHNAIQIDLRNLHQADHPQAQYNHRHQCAANTLIAAQSEKAAVRVLLL
jgi:hypothetical protein